MNINGQSEDFSSKLVEYVDTGKLRWHLSFPEFKWRWHKKRTACSPRGKTQLWDEGKGGCFVSDFDFDFYPETLWP